MPEELALQQPRGIEAQFSLMNVRSRRGSAGAVPAPAALCLSPSLPGSEPLHSSARPFHLFSKPGEARHSRHMSSKTVLEVISSSRFCRSCASRSLISAICRRSRRCSPPLLPARPTAQATQSHAVQTPLHACSQSPARDRIPAMDERHPARRLHAQRCQVLHPDDPKDKVAVLFNVRLLGSKCLPGRRVINGQPYGASA